MIGHVIAEERFLHHAMEHHLFVTKMDGAEHEYRFEVRRTPPGADKPETEFESTRDFAGQLKQCPNTTIDQLLEAEMQAIRRSVVEEDKLHTHDP